MCVAGVTPSEVGGFTYEFTRHESHPLTFVASQQSVCQIVFPMKHVTIKQQGAHLSQQVVQTNFKLGVGDFVMISKERASFPLLDGVILKIQGNSVFVSTKDVLQDPLPGV